MLDLIKRDLKNFVSLSQHEEVFRRLKEEILRHNNCELFNDTVVIQSRHSDSKRANNLGTIDFREKNLHFNNVSQALVWLIDSITISDLKEDLWKKSEDHKALREYHAYTCDRHDQNDQFQQAYYSTEQIEKVRLFYLYGDSRQSHESLHERLGRDLGSHLLNWEEGDFEPGTKVLFKTLKPTVHRIPLLYKIEVIKTLFSKFFSKINDKEPVHTKTIVDLMSSPDLATFGQNDFVFVLLTMDDANWNKDITPAAVETFITSFLSAKLPQTAPTFFFFFGIEYQKDNPIKRQEVNEAIKNRKFGGEALDELLPIGAADITEWFSRYRRVMVERGKEPREMTEAFFGPVETIDMKEVEGKLLELISQYNKGLIIRTENLKRNG